MRNHFSFRDADTEHSSLGVHEYQGRRGPQLSLAEIWAERLNALEVMFNPRVKFAVVAERVEVVAGQVVKVKVIESAYEKFRTQIDAHHDQVHGRLTHIGERGGRVWTAPQR